jgi:Protein of unknown function (DUF3263)
MVRCGPWSCASVVVQLGKLAGMARVSQPGAQSAEGASRDAVRRAPAPRPREDAESLVDAGLPADAESLVDDESRVDADSLVDAAEEAGALDAIVFGEAVVDAAVVDEAVVDAAVVDAAVVDAAVDGSSADAPGRAEPGRGVPDAAATAAPRRTLTDRERAMLEFERLWWRHAGAKEQAIRETFDLSSTHYYRLLNALLDVPAAAEFDALVVGRLRRLRASRARRRSGR